MAIGMDTQKIADIKRTDLSVAANYETAGPKRTVINADNAQRETIAAQTKANEKAQSLIVGAADGNPAVEALSWIDKRLSQISREVTSPSFEQSPRNILLVNMELNRLPVLAQTVVRAEQAQQELREIVTRRMLLGR